MACRRQTMRPRYASKFLSPRLRLTWANIITTAGPWRPRIFPTPVRRPRHPAAEEISNLLHVGNFPVQEGHFQILIYIELLRTEIDNLLRFAHCCLNLIRSHSFLDALRLSLLLRLLLLLTLVSLLALISLALRSLLSTLVPATLLRIVADREHLPDNIFHFSRTRFLQ